MKKTGLIVSAVVIVGALAWSGLWFVGRGEISERLDAEITRLAAQGVEVTHGARQIDGFPFAYRVTHSEVALREPQYGVVYSFPEITTEVSADDIDRLVTSFPEKFRIDVPLPPEAGYGADAMRLDIEARDLVVVTEGLPGAQRKFASTAESVLIATGGEAQAVTMAVEFSGLDYSGTLPDPSVGGTAIGATKLDRMDYAISGSTSEGIPFTFEGLIDRLVMTGRAEAVDGASWPDLRSGNFTMTYQTGASKLALRAVNGEEPQGGTLVISAASNAGTATADGGVIEVSASSRQSNVKLLPEPMPESLGADGFGADLRLIETIYKAPVAPSDTMAPFTLRFAMDEVVPDEALWSLLDAPGALPRDAARLVADIEGTGRITKSMAEVGPQEALPLEFGNVLVKALDMNAMGASIKTRGEMEFLQPINLPQGEVTITQTGVMNLVTQLSESGLLGPEVLQTAAILTAIYTAPGENPGELVSEITMTLDGITVNGRPVGGP
jgi:hypothetical protein